jgi:hypothetical protein
MEPRRALSIAALPLLLAMSACQRDSTSGTPAATQQAGTTITSDPSDTPLSAADICRAAAPGDEVLGAWPTTVAQVREREGGPALAPGQSPAPRPWAELDGATSAAWCTLDRGGEYSVSAATEGEPLLDFMITQTPPGAYPRGPAIP